MLTRCPNENCLQTYRVLSSHIGQSARCKRCQRVFQIEEYVKPSELLNLPIEESSEEGEAESNAGKGKRRSSKEIMAEKISFISDEINKIIPALQTSLKRQENESDTRLIIDRILQKALGYDIEDIKTEQRIEGRRADYVLTIGNEDKIIGEVKKIGMPLRDTQIFQASSYAAFSGIPWVFLTNGLVWQLYHISTGEKIETDLVFTVDLKDGLDETEAEHFYLISKAGMARKGLLDKLWRKMSTLCNENIVATVLTDDVVSKIRAVLNKRSAANVSDDDVRGALENILYQLG